MTPMPLARDSVRRRVESHFSRAQAGFHDAFHRSTEMMAGTGYDVRGRRATLEANMRFKTVDRAVWEPKFVAGSGLLLPDSHRLRSKATTLVVSPACTVMYRTEEACPDATVCLPKGKAACVAEVYCGAFLGFDVKQKAPIVL